jgi:acylphosphatase
MMTSSREIVQVVISGKVQGVGYRLWAKAAADRLGLAGWVRYTERGAIEAVFAGEPEAVAEILETCQAGSPMAQVETVDVRRIAEDEARLVGLTADGDGDTFIVLPDA